jgi:hypothetical protein
MIASPFDASSASMHPPSFEKYTMWRRVRKILISRHWKRVQLLTSPPNTTVLSSIWFETTDQNDGSRRTEVDSRVGYVIMGNGACCTLQFEYWTFDPWTSDFRFHTEIITSTIHTLGMVKAHETRLTRTERRVVFWVTPNTVISFK